MSAALIAKHVLEKVDHVNGNVYSNMSGVFDMEVRDPCGMYPCGGIQSGLGKVGSSTPLRTDLMCLAVVCAWRCVGKAG